MKKFAISLVVLASSWACSPVKTTNSETESIVLRNNRWQNPKAIPVCIVNRGALGAELFNDVKNHTINEYASKAGMNFVGWGDCTAQDNQSAVIRVYFNRTHNWNGGGGVSAGGGLSMVGPARGACGGTCAGGTMRIDIGSSGNYPTGGYRQFTITQTRATMIHEFGHAVGLLHEHERTDAARCRDIATKERQSNNVVYVGNYDPNSIMNYCHDGNLTTLSAGDVAGIKYLYPTLGGGAPIQTPTPAPAPAPAPRPNPTPAPAPQPNPNPGNIPANSFVVVTRNANKCVDVSNSNKADGAKVQQWDCNRSSAQAWQVIDGGAGSFFLRNANSGKCLDVQYSSRDNGAVVWQYTCNNSNAQRFYAQATNSGYYNLVFANSGKCLDVTERSNDSGAAMQQWDCAGAQPNQEFRFYRAN